MAATTTKKRKRKKKVVKYKECPSCGVDIPKDATKCPNCDHIFDKALEDELAILGTSSDERRALDLISALPSIGKSKGNALYDAGFKNVKDLREATVEELMTVDGIGLQTAQKIKITVALDEKAEGTGVDVVEELKDVPVEDDRSEVEITKRERRAKALLSAVPGIGKLKAKALFEAGFRDVQDLRGASVDELLLADGLNLQTAQKIKIIMTLDERMEDSGMDVLEELKKQRVDEEFKCPECGMILHIDIEECYECGTKFVEEPVSPSPAPKEPVSPPSWTPLAPEKRKKAEKILARFKKSLDKEFKKGKLTAAECKVRVAQQKIALGLIPSRVEDEPKAVPGVVPEPEAVPEAIPEEVPEPETIPEAVPEPEAEEEQPVETSEDGITCPSCQTFLPIDAFECTNCGVLFAEGEEEIEIDTHKEDLEDMLVELEEEAIDEQIIDDEFEDDLMGALDKIEDNGLFDDIIDEDPKLAFAERDLKVDKTYLIIGIILCLAGCIGVIGLRLGYIQNLLGDPAPYAGIGYVEPSGHIVSIIPWVFGMISIFFWGLKNNSVYQEIQRQKQEKESLKEELLEVIEERPDIPDEFLQPLDGLEDATIVEEIGLLEDALEEIATIEEVEVPEKIYVLEGALDEIATLEEDEVEIQKKIKELSKPKTEVPDEFLLPLDGIEDTILTEKKEALDKMFKAITEMPVEVQEEQPEVYEPVLKESSEKIIEMLETEKEEPVESEKLLDDLDDLSYEDNLAALEDELADIVMAAGAVEEFIAPEVIPQEILSLEEELDGLEDALLEDEESQIIEELEELEKLGETENEEERIAECMAMLAKVKLGFKETTRLKRKIERGIMPHEFALEIQKRVQKDMMEDMEKESEDKKKKEEKDLDLEKGIREKKGTKRKTSSKKKGKGNTR